MGVLLGAFCGVVFSFLGAMVFCFSFSFPFLFLCVIGGSGVLSHGVVFGLFFPFLFYFLFFVDIGTFRTIEHDTALLHMSTYTAERWHRAHGFCMCWGGEAPFVRNYTHTI